MKAKLGISVGLLASLTYLFGFFSGYVALVLVVGYILICEEDQYLRISAVKAVLLTVCVEVLIALIGFIPNLFEILGNFCSLFNAADFTRSVTFFAKIRQLVTVCNTIINVGYKVLMLLLALKALRKQTINIPVVDPAIAKHMLRDGQ